MQEGKPLCNHLDEFNTNFMDFKNIDIQVDNGGPTLILFCLLLDSLTILLVQCYMVN
jgi:hypothetical protein